jgi:hypothetical protein
MCEIISCDGQSVAFEQGIFTSSTFIHHLMDAEARISREVVPLVDRSCSGAILKKIRCFLNGETENLRFWFETIAEQSEKSQIIDCANFLDIQALLSFITGCKGSLHACIADGRADLVRTLIELKANPNEHGDRGKTLESLTTDSDCIREIRRSIKISENWTDAMIAAHEGDKQQAELHLIRNVQFPAYIDSKNKENRTALHYASELGHVDVVHILIQQKADVDAAGGAKIAALHFAAFAGHNEVITALLDAGAAVNAATDSRRSYSERHLTGTALYLAAKQGHARAAQLLLERKALVNDLHQVSSL